MVNKNIIDVQNAKFIVASNGSALNNLIFSNPSETKTIMIGQKNLFNWGGWFGSFKELGYDIEYLGGEVIGSERDKHRDYFVTPSALIKKVKSTLSLIL